MSYCDVYGCDQPAIYDFGKHIRVPGIPGDIRRLCHDHGVGLKAHRDCPTCTHKPPRLETSR